jgi:hypothetical protein
MAKTKYGHYIKKLEFEKGKSGPEGTAGPNYRTRIEGKEMEGLKLRLAWGYPGWVGKWGGAAEKTHVHSFSEVMVFSGLDYDHPQDFGAEIEIEMGPEGEKYVFNTPTIVTVPAGFVHAPLITRKMTRPYAMLGISLDGEYKADNLAEKGRKPPAPGKKYGDLVKKMEFRDLTQRPMGGNADYMAAWNGKNMEGFKLNFTFAFHKDTGPWHGGKDPHVHPNDEVLLFVGTDPERPDYLGAEIRIEMGKEREAHVFDYPAAVVAPKGFVHCPLVTRKVEKPYIFSAICLNTTHDTTWLGTGKFPWEQ